MAADNSGSAARAPMSHRKRPVSDIWLTLARGEVHRGEMVATPRTLTYGAAVHFGRQVKKERQIRHWTLRDLTEKTGLNFSYISQIEHGLRPPTEKVAAAMDKAFTERDGWFTEYYFDSLVGIPPGLRSWREHEDKAVRLDVWCPSVVDGLWQTPRYAEALLRTSADTTEDQVQARLKNRMEHQKRVTDRAPLITYVLDQVALIRLTGSPEVMVEQMDRLLELGALPNFTLLVLPVVAHAATASELIIADHSAAYVEYIQGGMVYIEPDRVDSYDKTFAAIRAECYRASEGAAIVRKARELWSGVSPRTATQTAGTASKPRRKREPS